MDDVLPTDFVRSVIVHAGRAWESGEINRKH